MAAPKWYRVGGDIPDKATGPFKVTLLCKDTAVDDNMSDNVPIVGVSIGQTSLLSRVLMLWTRKNPDGATDFTFKARIRYASGTSHDVGTFTLPASTAVATAIEFLTPDFDWPTFPDKAVLLFDVLDSDGYKHKNGVVTVVLVYVSRGAELPTAPGMGLGGSFDSGTTYALGDVVESGGSAFVSRIAGNTGNDPATNPDDWGLIATGGAPGDPGVGVPSGGTTGQVLAKNSPTDFDTEWIDPVVGVPSGGAVGQTIIKQSTADFDFAFQDYPHTKAPDTHKFLTGFDADTADFSNAQPTDADLSVSDITTNNATSGRHGFLSKLSGSAADFLDGTGAWAHISDAFVVNGLATVQVNGADVSFDNVVEVNGA